jgi:hypothetical protein
LVNRLLPKFF